MLSLRGRKGIILQGMAALMLMCGCQQQASKNSTATADQGGKGKRLHIGVLPKLVGIDYFNAVEKGAREASKELNVDLTWDGPVSADVAKQAEMMDTWIAQGMDAIVAQPNDPNALAPTMKKAQKRGIYVLTCDTDSTPDSRSYFVNQSTAEDVGNALVDEMADQIGGKGEVAIVTGSMTADNQNTWMKFMRKRIAEKFPGINVVKVEPSEEDQQLATQVTKDLLKAYPNLKGIFGITSVAFPGAALAVREAGKSGKIAVVGLSTPKSMKEYVHDGTVKTVILWNPVDLGYLTIYASKAVVEGHGKLGKTIHAGRLGDIQVSGTQVLLGKPTKWNKDNIDKYDF